MLESIHWRKRLLGTLQGQLEAAAFLVVLVGFTVASTASLVVAQQTKLEEHHNRVSRLVNTLERCIKAIPSRPLASANSPEIQRCLERSCGLGSLFWIEFANGSLVTLPAWDYGINPAAILVALQRNPGKEEMLNTEYRLGDATYLARLHVKYPGGHRIWIVEDVTEQFLATTRYILATSLIWFATLALMLIAIFYVVRRLLEPLRRLVSEVDLIAADSLATASIQVSQAPREIQEIMLGYNRLLQRLSSSWESQRQFSNAVSHELRTPLTIVSGYIRRVLKRGDNLTSKQRQELLTASHENSRAIRLIQDLLDLSRSDSGHLVFVPELVQPSQLLEELVQSSCHEFISLLRLSLPAQPEDRSLCINVNPDRFRQVVLNLLENAQKYSSAECPIDLNLQRCGNTFVIEIVDYGIGILADDLPHVFDRFFPGATAVGRQGSGLGLSVVKLLVHAMDGSIAVKSIIAESTTFAISFPICLGFLPLLLSLLDPWRSIS